MPSPELRSPRSAGDWTGLTRAPIPVAEALTWAVRPDCGAVVSFTGSVRDHAEGRPGVTMLEYEAYETEVESRLTALVAQARSRWTGLGRLVVLHRVGSLRVGEAAVLVVASAPHRGEAFEAARWCIDTLKATLPIWKRETWEGGVDWGTCATVVADDVRVRDPPMSNLAYVLLALAFSILASVAVWYRRRQPRSLEYGVDEFQRELQALAPEHDRPPRVSDDRAP